MKGRIITFIFLLGLWTTSVSQDIVNEDSKIEYQETHTASDTHHTDLPMWSIIPFLLLLTMIATGPLFYPFFWHKSYSILSILLAGIIIFYYYFALHNEHSIIHSLVEYIQFISLLAGLYMASGGILITVDREATARTNVIVLVIGAIISNIIGTTGASMLLIRPFIRLNKNRIKPYHIVFFIFIVSNVGGSLTPIGDPPLFLGFLKGIPFLWTLKHNFFGWLVALIILLVVFYFIDKKNKEHLNLLSDNESNLTGKVDIKGKRNFIWLFIIIVSVFIDPNVFDWVPSIRYEGQNFSFIREIIILTMFFFSYKFANNNAIKGNEFTFEPLREVAFLFIGIFFTMMPALELISKFAQSPEGTNLISPNSLYWGTGILSGFLDNAPTYVNFLTAAMASAGADINNVNEVISYSNNMYTNSTLSLTAISLGAVFFGAFTYIGNGPNFMVKSIAEQVGIKMPSFFSYIARFSIPILLPVLFIIWLLFFY